MDLLVVGGGPVGLACAIEAAGAGMSVAVVEPRGAPVDKACGEGLMPAAVDALARLGVRPAGFPFTGIAYLDAEGSRSARAHFCAGTGLGVRRTSLSAALTARADEVGVKRISQAAGRIVSGDGWVEAAGVRAGYLVAADGLHSPIRRALGLDVPMAGARRYGLRQHFALAPWSDLVEVHWARDAEAYVTPVAQDVVGVAVLCPGGLSFDGWLERFPLLARRLRGARPASAVRGAGPLRRSARRHVSGRVLLVGDAAGYVDALTGEGIAVGLASAREAVRCVVDGCPEAYEAAWMRATRRYRVLTGGLLWAAQQPTVRRGIVPAAARLPAVFSAIVNRLG